MASHRLALLENVGNYAVKARLIASSVDEALGFVIKPRAFTVEFFL